MYVKAQSQYRPSKRDYMKKIMYKYNTFDKMHTKYIFGYKGKLNK
jgi:hypothetical protein